MKISKILSQLRNKVVYVALLILFLRLIEVSYFYLIPFLFILLFVIKRVPSLLIYTGCIFILISVSYQIIETFPKVYSPVFVKGDIKYDDITSFTGTQFGVSFKVYTDEKISVSPGDQIMIEGEFQEVIDSTIPHTFNYRNYLLSKRIKYSIFTESVDVVGQRWSFQSVRNNISNYIEQNAPLSEHYIKTFILADNSGFEENIEEDINILGISHLFAVSGLHIGLLTLVLDRLLKKFLPKVSPQKVIIPVLLLYMILTSFSPSVIRAGFLYCGIVLNKKYKLEFSMLDILSIIFLGYLIVSPYAIYSLGFSLSFLVTFSIILGQYMLKNKSNTIQLFVISVLAFLMALPITVSVNQELNLLTVFVNVFLIYGMSFVILPFGYLTFLFPFLDRLYYQLILLYELIIQAMARISFLRFDFVFVNHLHVILYYILVILLFGSIGTKKMNKRVMVLVIFFLISSNIQIFSPIKSVSMIDVYGDSIFIKDSFNRCNILIDTGVPDDYDSVISYIKGLGIKKIDYLIVTHEHSDHNGERSDIRDAFNVKKEIDTSNVVYRELKCGSVLIDFLSFEKYYRSENNKSLVFTLEIEHTTYLFTGDMEYKKEEEFVSLYDLEVDVLKSGHHGSITSSSEVFLEEVQAKEVWISCYRRNLHKHPHEVIIERYTQRNIEIYRTDLMGTIEQYYIFGKAYKKLHMP